MFRKGLSIDKRHLHLWQVRVWSQSRVCVRAVGCRGN
jgi:hypothetical protein